MSSILGYPIRWITTYLSGTLMVSRLVKNFSVSAAFKPLITDETKNIIETNYRNRIV